MSASGFFCPDSPVPVPVPKTPARGLVDRVCPTAVPLFNMSGTPDSGRVGEVGVGCCLVAELAAAETEEVFGVMEAEEAGPEVETVANCPVATLGSTGTAAGSSGMLPREDEDRRAVATELGAGRELESTAEVLAPDCGVVMVAPGSARPLREV